MKGIDEAVTLTRKLERNMHKNIQQWGLSFAILIFINSPYMAQQHIVENASGTLS